MKVVTSGWNTWNVVNAKISNVREDDIYQHQIKESLGSESGTGGGKSKRREGFKNAKNLTLSLAGVLGLSEAHLPLLSANYAFHSPQTTERRFAQSLASLTRLHYQGITLYRNLFAEDISESTTLSRFSYGWNISRWIFSSKVFTFFQLHRLFLVLLTLRRLIWLKKKLVLLTAAWCVKNISFGKQWLPYIREEEQGCLIFDGTKVNKIVGGWAWFWCQFDFWFWLNFWWDKKYWDCGWVDLAAGTSACLPSLIPDDQDKDGFWKWSWSYMKMVMIIERW